MRSKHQPLIIQLASRGIDVSTFNDPPIPQLYGWLADTILKSAEIVSSINSDWEYKSISELATEELCSMHQSLGHFEGTTEQLVDHVLTQLAKNFSRNLTSKIDYNEEGLILYEKQGNKYRETTNNNQDYSYVIRLNREGSLGDITYYEPPDWAKSLYINKANQRIFEYFYYDLDEEGFYEKAKKLKANAIRAYMEGLFDEHQVKGLSQEHSQNETLDPRERKTWGQIVKVLCKECDISLDKPFKAAEIIQKYAAKHSLEIPVKTDTIVRRIKDLPED